MRGMYRQGLGVTVVDDDDRIDHLVDIDIEGDLARVRNGKGDRVRVIDFIGRVVSGL
jgi:hypothetical protein